MSDGVKNTDNSKERVAFDLMARIAEAERVLGINEAKKSNPREYYLKLYNQCHQVVSWNGVDVKGVLKD